MKFSEMVKSNFPEKAIRVRVGGDESYMGINCRGLECMTAEQIKWLDNHTPLHQYYTPYKKEIEWVYRENKTYHQIVWGKR